jgi:hypothetical protein
MSRKHWSDLFLLVAAISLVLAALLEGYARVLSLLAFPSCLVTGTLVRLRRTAQ